MSSAVVANFPDGTFYDAAPAHAGSAVPCRIYEVNVEQPERERSFSDFDAFARELAADPASASAVAEGRKWVSSTFYGGKPTIAALRLAAGMSQEDLADACGLQQPHVSRYESGRIEPKVLVARKLAAALGVTVDDFIQAFENSRGDCDYEQLSK
jgi:ribosome-binding protein aMBF1 (putative translation factor)